MLSTVSSKPETLTLYRQMALIRALEDELQQLCDRGEGADLHFSKGQEGIAVGVCAALRPTDYVVTHHRTIAHAVAKGVPLEALVAEVLGKPGGLCGGRAGEMHLSHAASRFMFCWQLVGTCVPVAAGLAWAVKNVQKTDDIVVVFHGDAATSNGQWHEGMNLAAVQRVPLLVICENNGLAGNVRPEHYMPSGGVINRAESFCVDSQTIDGNQISDVYEAAKKAAEYVRHHQRPFFLNCLTTRLGRHKQGQGDLRSKEEMAELALRDPLRGDWEAANFGVRREVRDVIKRVIE
jgi:pyruvate dehydrogenase E1 component alpha subunit